MVYKTDEQIKEDIVGLVDRLIDRNRKLEETNRELYRRVKEPNDEKLAQAYAKISELEEELERVRLKSL